MNSGDDIQVADSRGYPGSIHDKTIWNDNFDMVQTGSHVLADKAYAGADGEGKVLFRPVKRNERVWKDDPEGAKAANRALSKKRVKIEHLFARLKTWRIVRQYPNRPETIGEVFKAVAFIHNLNIGRSN